MWLHEPAQVTVHAATHSSAVKVDDATVEDQKVSLNEAVAPEEATEEVENTNTSEKVESEVPSIGQELHDNLSVSEYEKAVADAAFDALNRLRAENGLDPLQRDDALEATSESRASDVAGTDTNGELHHAVGGTAANAKAHGYTGESNDLVVENLASYSQSGEDFVSYVDPKQLGEDFVNQFYAERGFPDGNHRFNMLNPNFTRAGIGVKVEGNKVVMSQHISLQDSDLDYDKYKEYADWTDTHNVQSDDRTRGLDSLDDFLFRRSGANSYQYDAHK